MTERKTNADQLITTIISGIEDVKGKEITVLDLRDIENTVCDYFIVCEGTSNTQVNAIVNSIQKQVSKTLKDKPWHIEGTDNAEWVLMDYVNVVVHVFKNR
jgi:ribosome-associated protein